MTLEEATEAIKAPDEAAMQAAKAWWDSRAKLPGSLGALETMVIRLAGIQRTARPQALRKRAVVFCADNGVAAQGGDAVLRKCHGGSGGEFRPGRRHH